MSTNLDRSLDEILASRPRGGRRGGKAAPAGGIRKRSQRAAAQKANVSVTPNASKAALTRNAPTGPANKVTASKIIVSNLPFDVNEGMIKEYFQSVVGPIRRAILTYGPDGRSRGVATVEFTKPEHAAIAAQKYNGVEVDKKPMKVELVVDPNAPASFADRVGAPNKVTKAEKPKPAAAKPARGRGGARGNKRGGAGGRGGSGRGKPKTAEQLDQEMADYFGNNDNSANATTTTTAAPAAAPAASNGDVGMDEDTVL